MSNFIFLKNILFFNIDSSTKLVLCANNKIFITWTKNLIKLNSKELDDMNKGKQILKKMGWSTGSGLGMFEQGINKPIIVTENKDSFTISENDNSVNDDVFANFRKNKGAAFIHRMRARAEEKEMMKIQLQRP